MLGFFNQVAPKQKRKVPTIIAQPLSKDAEQNSIKTSCLGCRRLMSTAQKATSKIILHRIISAVWLTNFLSEIQSLSNHDDETQFRILSVKPIWSFSAFDHWWSLTVQLWAVMDGEWSEWAFYLHLSSRCIATQGGAASPFFRVCIQLLLNCKERNWLICFFISQWDICPNLFQIVVNNNLKSIRPWSILLWLQMPVLLQLVWFDLQEPESLSCLTLTY